MNSLNGNYKDQINGLYENVQYVVKKNKLCNNNQGCSGAAVFQMTLSQSKINKNVQRKIDQNREKYNALVEEIVSKDYKSLVLNLESLEITVKSLLSPNADPSVTTDIAIHFFYEVIKKYNDDIQNFSPTSETCNTILGELGTFVQNNQETEGLKILELALQRPQKPLRTISLKCTNLLLIPI
uniref:Uncharacterized protein n=1 Tax=Megaselia scalaris TaxID=36166 RepID=T1GWX5_MEGSC